MATGTYAMITDLGLNKINANPDGVYIEVAYYVPAYDWRIDSDVNNLYADGEAMKGSGYQVSSCTSPYDVVPSGIVYWNISSDDNSYVFTDNVYVLNAEGTSFDSSTIFNAKQSSYTTMTTVSDGTIPASYGVTPDWSFISMDGTITVSQNSSDVADFDVTDGGGVDAVAINDIGPDDVDAFDPDVYLYRGVSYNEVVTSGTDSRANFRVSVKAPKGVVKFNKLGLYAVQRTSNSDIVGNPFLFGQVIFPETQIVNTEANSVEGQIGELVLDFQMDVQAATKNFSDVMYATSADYWQQVSDITGDDSDGLFGLSYSGNVYITNTLAVDDKNFYFNTSADRGIAKTLIATFEKVNAINPSREKDMPQLCLQYVTARNGAVPSKRLRTTFMTTSAGDCVVDFYGQCGTTEQNSSLRPYENDQFDIGTTDYRWRRLYASNASIGQTITSVNPYQGEITFDMSSDGSSLVTFTNSDILIQRGDNASADYFMKGNVSNHSINPIVIRAMQGISYRRGTYYPNIYIDTTNLASVTNSTLQASIQSKFTFTDWFSGDSTVYMNGTVAIAGKIMLGGEIPTDGSDIDGIVPNADNTISLGSYDIERYATIRRFQRVITGYIGSSTPVDADNADELDQYNGSTHVGNHLIPYVSSVVDIGHWHNSTNHRRFRHAYFSGIGSFETSVDTPILNVGTMDRTGGYRANGATGTIINNGTINTKTLNIPFTVNSSLVAEAESSLYNVPTIINASGIQTPYIHVGRLVADSVDVYKDIYKDIRMENGTWVTYNNGGNMTGINGDFIIPFSNLQTDQIKTKSYTMTALYSDRSGDVLKASLAKSLYSNDNYKLSFPLMTMPIYACSDNTLGTPDFAWANAVYKINDFVGSCVRLIVGNDGLDSTNFVINDVQYITPTRQQFSRDSDGNGAFYSDYNGVVSGVTFDMYIDTDGSLNIKPNTLATQLNSFNKLTEIPMNAIVNVFEVYFTCTTNLVTGQS